MAIPQQPREQALLALLMLHAETPQPRQRFAFTFWPDLPESRAFANLRYTLHHLRRTCPELEPYILSTQSTLHWQPPQAFWLDVAEFARLADRADTTAEPAQLRSLLAQAAELYSGDLLPGCYDDWIVPQREQLAQRHIHVLQRLVDVLADQQELGAALEVATRLRHADPLREQTYQRLMELYAQAGDRAAALRAYHECVAIMAAELNVEPSRETQLLYTRLLEHDTIPPGLNHVARPRVDNAAPAREPPPLADRLVGRELELNRLLHAWEQVGRGQSQLVLIRGEGGIGKTRLAEELANRVAQQRHAAVRTRAYAAEGQLVYAPLITLLRAEPYRPLLHRLDSVWQVELARLLPELRSAHPDLPPAAPLTDHGRRQHLFEALARATLSIGLPLLILIDDLQWADQETSEWLHYLLRFDPGAALLVVGTTRNEELVDSHPLNTLRLDMLRSGQCEEIDLKELDAVAGAQLAQQVADRALDPATVTALFKYAQGVPLFLVEAVRAGVTPRDDEPWQRAGPLMDMQAAHALPPRIYAILHARLTQLSDDARALANMAAVIGRAFSLDLLMLATGVREEVLVRGLDELWRRRIVMVQGLDYDFSHDRIRDVAYAELAPMQRRVLHRKAAHALEQVYAHDLDAVSAQLAWHHEVAGQFRQAVDYYARAGAIAQRVYANTRAAELSTKGLALLVHIPADPDRDRQELALQITLAAAVRTKGYVVREVTQALDRAWELSRKLGDVRQYFWPLSGLFAYHFIRGEVARSQEVATELMAIADQAGDPELLLVAHSNAGAIWLHAGDQGTAQTYFARCTDLYTPKLHAELVMFIGLDYGVVMPSWRGHHAWMIGQPEQALRFSQDASDVTRQLAHPLSQALVMVYRTMLHQFRREGQAAYAQAVQVRSLTAAHEMIYYHNWAEILVQLETARLDSSPGAIADLHTALAQYQENGAAMRLPYFLAGLAEIYALAHDLDAALDTLTAAQTVADQQGEHWWDAELLRLRAGLLDQQGAPAPQVDALLQEALAIAQRQQATSLALRAATSLARRRVQTGQTVAAVELLAPIYAQFGEGFATADLQEAHALLTQIG